MGWERRDLRIQAAEPKARADKPRCRATSWAYPTLPATLGWNISTAFGTNPLTTGSSSTRHDREGSRGVDECTPFASARCAITR